MPIPTYGIALYINCITGSNNTLNTILMFSLVSPSNYLFIGNILLILLLKPLI